MYTLRAFWGANDRVVRFDFLHVDKSRAAGRVPESRQDLFRFEFETSPE